MAGVTSSGFEGKTVADLTADLNDSARGVYGASANVDPRSRLGQLIGLFALALSETWELAEVIAAAFDPMGASGVLLDNLSALTGTVRKVATKSTATLYAIGTAGTVLPAGRRASVTGTSTAFETLASGTIAAATAWAASTVYSAGAVRAASGSLWRAMTSGTSSTTAPNGVGPLFVDGTVTWRLLGAGSAYAEIAAEATVTGPLQGFTGAITTIDTPVAGWALVTNATDAIPGRNLETDAELRVRRARDVAGIGSSPLGAVQAAISNLAGVSFAALFENATDATVGTIGPHGLELLVEGGDDATIAQKLLDSKAGGIATFGTTSLTRNTSNGDPVVVNFTRPALVDVWVKITLSKQAGLYPSNGDDQVKAAIVAWGDALALGRDVVPSAIAAEVFRTIPGVLDVSAVLVGLSNPPASSTPLVFTIRQRANYDTGRIEVVSTNGVP